MKISRAKKFEEMGQLGLGFGVEEMTRVPQSDWVPSDPSTWPDRLAGDVGVDTEVHDKGLDSDQGPGWAWRGGGEVAGYSVTADNFSAYLPTGHEGGGNLDPGQVKRWLNHVLSDPAQTKIFANALYDVPWAKNDGVRICGPIVDIQLVEALLDEHRRQYSLDSIARDRVGKGKNEELLEGALRAFGHAGKGGISKLHSKYVGPYAIEDSVLPRDVWKIQRPLVAAEGLVGICDLEHALIPMYIDMRRRGVRVDLDRAERLKERFKNDVKNQVAAIKHGTGVDVDIWAADSVAKVLDWAGITYSMTPRSKKPSITNDLLEGADHWVCRAILEARQRDKLVGTFLEGQVIGQCHDGRVHGSIHPLKGDEGGTVTGRISMSNPNLLFIPARTEEGKLIRTCFLPEEDEEWASLDFSQQEPRLTVHFAIRASKCTDFPRELRARLATALEAQKLYCEDPGMSYHKFVADITGLAYKRAKILNLAIIYGRGIKETAEELGLGFDETKRLFDQHAQKMPFARAMSEAAQNRVRERGHITTLLGRRQRFSLWEPQSWEARTGEMHPIEEAKKRWPNQWLVRARVHKALNAIIQPSAADQMKKAMLNVWRAGYGRHVMIQVYDELDLSIPDGEIAGDVSNIMQEAVKLEVPVVVKPEFGPNWGAANQGSSQLMPRLPGGFHDDGQRRRSL